MARMIKWDELEDSACAGDAVAAFELAMRHASGSGGLTVNLVQAHRWFNVAGTLGHAPAIASRGEIATEMSAAQISEAQRLARATSAGRLRRAA